MKPVLEDAQRLGFLGPGSIERHVEHSLGFVDLLESLPPDVLDRPVLDLGSGGGIPGLVIAAAHLSPTTTLLEGSARRSAWLAAAAERLGLTGSVVVIGERAEVAGHVARHRYAFGAVVARLFARPAVTAECAAPFLGDEGTLIVSEPVSKSEDRPGDGGSHASGAAPEAGSRWPEEGLAGLGLGEASRHTARGYGFVTISRLSACGDRYPRRTGIPAKRPLF